MGTTACPPPLHRTMNRPLLPSDLNACVDLFIRTFALPPWNETWPQPLVKARLEQITGTPGWSGVVTTDDGGSIIAFALGVAEPWHEGSHFFLKECCVDHSHQRQGIGTRLMEYLAEQLQQGDTTRIYLLTARGDMSEAFYEKIGFYTSPRMILMARRFGG